MTRASRKVIEWPPVAVERWTPADRRLAEALRPADLPRHIAIIMDGNGRWARQHGYRDRIRGHEAGIEAVRQTTRTCASLGVDFLTLFSFSKENWQRPRREVLALMRLLQRFAVDERPELMESGIRLRVIGQLADLPAYARDALLETVRLTAANKATTLTLALSYGGRDEILRAARALAEAAAAGEIDPAQINEAGFAARLDTAGVPDPDLLIRTSGEMRVSNFLLWQIAYAEIHVSPVLWPDFRRRHLLESILDFQRRERRFGGVGTALPRWLAGPRNRP